MVGRMVAKYHIQFVAIQETKVKEVRIPVLNEIWKHNSYKGVQVGAVGRSCGLLSLWRDDYFKLIEVVYDQQWIATYVSFLPLNVSIMIINVYAPKTEVLKNIVWNQLADMLNDWNGPACILGDFNSTRFSKERLRENQDEANMVNFNNFLLNCNLLDQNIVNESFTWEGPLGKKSRIDRVLLNVESASFWAEASLFAADSDLSDHKPLVWAKNLVFWGPKPFKFINLWFKQPGFYDKCKTAWQSFKVNGWAAFVLQRKLILLKEQLKSWHSVETLARRQELSNCENSIRELNSLFEQRDLSIEEYFALIVSKAQRRILKAKEESRRRMFSRINWLKVGLRTPNSSI
ncbi:uncharacterized protein [Rutidosis leptorrhynchoides]|uniref:uncharacterized protein n=1 Tax=Rutidosis leptorrhynchoides TaxID=125765 RepID=UPI003A996390